MNENCNAIASRDVPSFRAFTFTFTFAIAFAHRNRIVRQTLFSKQRITRYKVQMHIC